MSRRAAERARTVLSRPRSRAVVPRTGADPARERQRLYRTCGRARDRLVLSNSLGGWASGTGAAVRSRFIDEMIARDVPIRSMSGEPPDSVLDGTVSSAANAVARRPSLLAVAVDQIVVHPRFGRGVVRAVDSLGTRATATIAFEQGGTKRIVVAHALLQPAPPP